MKDWYGDSQLRLWSERNRGQWNPDEEVVPDSDSEEAAEDSNTTE